MKTTYILFCSQIPKDQEAILDIITHFCREHSLYYRIHPDSDRLTITINGYDYTVHLQEKNDGAEPAYWMICCSLKSNPKTFQKSAAA